VHTVADVNTAKDDRRQKEGKSPRDGDAAWGVKHTKRVRDDKGNSVKIPHYFHGYKMHASLNTVSELITSLTVTPGNAYPVQSAQDCVMGTNCQRCWSRT